MKSILKTYTYSDSNEIQRVQAVICDSWDDLFFLHPEYSEQAFINLGTFYKNVFATHLHGPLLPKNPILCDIIIARALKENLVNLKPLDDSFEQIALEEIEKKVMNSLNN